MEDYIKFVELTQPRDKQDLIKKSIRDFSLFLAQFKHKDDDDDEDEETEQEVIIYQILSNDQTITDSYVGRTTQSIEERWYQHKKTGNTPTYKYHNKLLYEFIRNNGGFDQWRIIELEKCICKNKFEMREKEQSWIDTKGATLNKIRAQKNLILS